MLKIVVLGLGYVGLPIAISFAKKYETFGFDIDKEKIRRYKNGIDVKNEINNKELKETTLKFTTNEKVIKNADFVIVAVPTPLNKDNTPNLSLLKNASITVAKNMKKGCIVIYESTVYPGATEEICIPILEKYSGMNVNKDFFVGYSPERINPGDKIHTFENVSKLVSGSREDITEEIFRLYKNCIKANVIKVSSIKIAEAAKIVENSQRDINIAFINEISKLFHLMNINTKEVLEAASTKWNFLNFEPGLVGGHCISVDPYYLSYKAQQLGMEPQVILSGRKVNDFMWVYIVEQLKAILQNYDMDIKKTKILIKGLTFKENVSDIRNSKVIEIAKKLKEEGVQVFLEDYNVNKEELRKMYNFSLDNNIPKVDVVIIAVKHSRYYKINIEDLDNFYVEKNNPKILFDLYSIFKKEKLEKKGFLVWNL